MKIKTSSFAVVAAVLLALALVFVVPVAADAWDGTTVDTVWYESDNKSTEFTISTPAELAGLAKLVNEGDVYENDVFFEGKTITLGANIDLNNEQWTPIGSAYKDHGFMGNFDGNGYKISNLNMTGLVPDSDGYVYAGLFGVTEGTDKDNQNFIKNLIIENVNIETIGHIVSAAIAYPYYTIVDNITVCGNISITGGDYTSGVLAYTRRCVDASNLYVVGNEGSTITGSHTVGGVISDIQMNGGLTADYSNFCVSGVTITGDMHVGGISGIISAQTLETAKVENVELVSSDSRVGVVSGSLGGTSTITGITVTNVYDASSIIGGAYDTGNPVEAKIGDTYYKTLQGALTKVENGDVVTLLDDVTLTETVHIYNGDKVTLDLNGKTIDYDHDVWVYGAANSGTALLTVDFGGELTIEDSSDAQTGTLDASYTADGWGHEQYDVYSAVMMTAKGDNAENGVAKLTVNGGTLKGFFAAVAGNKDRDNTEIIINGGKLTVGIDDTYSTAAIEHPMNGKLTINGGTIEGMDGISLRSGTLLITGGTIIGTAPESAFDEDDYWDNNFAACTGHALQIVSRASSNPANENPTVSITGGTFSAANTVAIGNYAAAGDTALTAFITGGTFSSNPSAYIASGYEVVQPGDKYLVQKYVDRSSSSSSSSSTTEPEEPVDPEQPEEPVVEPETPVDEPEAGEATVETEVTDGGEVELETPTEEPAVDEGGAVVADDDAKITAVVLPIGTDSEVIFIPVSEQPAPAGQEENTKKVFEINVPTYEKGKAAVIKFTMTVAELEADGKTAGEVALWHFDEETGEWTKLVTSYTIVDGVVYFEAITNDFSPFAIIYEDEPVDEPVEEPETPATPAPVLGLLAALGAAVALRRK